MKTLNRLFNVSGIFVIVLFILVCIQCFNTSKNTVSTESIEDTLSVVIDTLTLDTLSLEPDSTYEKI
jgi:hypothetical protein